MERDAVIAKLRAREAELKAEGVESLAVFGSVAHGDNDSASDVDVAVRMAEGRTGRGFAYFAQLASLRQILSRILERPVDLVIEPVNKDSLRERIEKERAVAF